jgi:hypothetical protein
VDLKWYKDMDEEPFLQLVPSYGGQPQVVMRRMKVGHRSMNTSIGQMIDQMLVMDRPSIDISGKYHCRVSTFYEDTVSTLDITVFGREYLAITVTDDDDEDNIYRSRCWPCPSLFLTSRLSGPIL